MSYDLQMALLLQYTPLIVVISMTKLEIFDMELLLNATLKSNVINILNQNVPISLLHCKTNHVALLSKPDLTIIQSLRNLSNQYFFR